ncbi:MAG: LysR substrate-binding domain-containing protein [Steroidobacteraceae bacterium]
MLFPRRFLPPMSVLCAFEAAARHLSFTAAAEELNLTQSAVSRQIRSLEKLLGSELFVRERQAVRLTRAGEAYAEEVRRTLRRISSATLAFRANPEGGALNLAVLPTFGTRWLAPRLAGFLAANPGITVNLTTYLAPSDFLLETVDAAVHFGLPHWPGAELEFLMSESVVPACSGELLRAHRFSEPADLLKAPLLHLTSRPDAWENWFRTKGVDTGNIHGMLVDQFAIAAQAGISGLGVALLPTFLIEGELARGDLVKAVPATPVESTERYYLAWSPGRASYPPLAAFRNWIQERARSCS